MSIGDSLLSRIAPYLCFGCGSEGDLLCSACCDLYVDTIESRCAGCKKLTRDYRSCTSCNYLPARVYVAGVYDGIYEQLIEALKFDVQRMAALPMSRIMTSILPLYPEDAVLCPVPTAPRRIRSRGFDHAKYLAVQLRQQWTDNKTPLVRVDRLTNSRQVGATRAQRFEQLKGAFVVRDPLHVKDKTVYIVDDVMTSGATLSSMKKVLYAAGAKRVYAIVFAQKI